MVRRRRQRRRRPCMHACRGSRTTSRPRASLPLALPLQVDQFSAVKVPEKSLPHALPLQGKVVMVSGAPTLDWWQPREERSSSCTLHVCQRRPAAPPTPPAAVSQPPCGLPAFAPVQTPAPPWAAASRMSCCGCVLCELPCRFVLPLLLAAGSPSAGPSPLCLLSLPPPLHRRARSCWRRCAKRRSSRRCCSSARARPSSASSPPSSVRRCRRLRERCWGWLLPLRTSRQHTACVTAPPPSAPLPSSPPLPSAALASPPSVDISEEAACKEYVSDMKEKHGAFDHAVSCFGSFWQGGE